MGKGDFSLNFGDKSKVLKLGNISVVFGDRNISAIVLGAAAQTKIGDQKNMMK